MSAKRTLFCSKLLTTPSAPLRNGIFLLMAQPPILENGGEWTRPATNHSPRVATCATVLLEGNHRRYFRSTVTGSVFAARQAGIRHANDATSSKNSVTATMVKES